MAQRQQTFTKTPFKTQAAVIQTVLRTNPIFNDDEKASLQETIGILTWLNQLQLHWDVTKKSVIPDDIKAHIFEGRTPIKMTAEIPA